MTPRSAPPSALPPRVVRGYALGSVATGAFGTVPGLLLLPYLTDRLGVAAGLAGAIVFLPKAWDVVLNPVAGRISDHTVSPSGPRRPFLLRGGVALALAFAVLFAGPASPQGVSATWVVVAFLACATAYAFFQVPYVAMPAEMTDDYGERTRLMIWRVAVLALAILVSGASAPAIRDAVGPAQGYRVMGLVVAALILVGVLGAWRGTAAAPTRVVPASAGGLAAQLRIVAAAKDFRMLLGTFVLQALATGAMLAGVDYVARHVLGRPGASTVLFVCFVGPALLVTPVWQRVGAVRGKRWGYAAASVLLAAGALALVAARSLPLVLVYLAVAVVGVGYAGAQVFPLAMLPDVAAVDAARSGANRIGVFTGVWTAGETLGLALGPGLYAVVLAVGGYVSSTDSTAVQPDSAVTAIGIGFSVVPAALVAVSLLLLARYRLDEAAVSGAAVPTHEEV
ncbi:Na+/melibiose symporter [Pedococcus dokdonensis]|uniref:Na+/melibiose symporter n=1 Tax=Pedococcus dokdonensis TaxID=443156 RepID=A0A1H0UC79_9MICO|nr:MFS transporter [Pedococcus dokdonensis]SDP63741.1 Na+/melibiose symporter [Pedococcus dokdonensis]